MAEKSGNLSQLALEVGVNSVAVFAAGDYAGAASLADQALDLARREGSDTCLRLAHEAQFVVRYSRGDLVGAEEHFTRWRGICEVSGFGPFPALTTLGFAYGGYCAWALGLSDKARERMAKASAFAHDSKSPYEIPQALAWESAMYTSLREPERAEAAATRALALCEEGGFLYMAEVARVYLGWARAQLGCAGEGVALLRRGVAGLIELKTKAGITAQLTYLAEAQALDGALVDALVTIENALEANPDEAVTRPDAFTLRGELQLKIGKRELAEADFREAIALAQRTSAKIMELRATMSLARLLDKQGKRDEARAMLAEIYNWFTEGFDTADLKDAKALLDQLNA